MKLLFFIFASFLIGVLAILISRTIYQEIFFLKSWIWWAIAIPFSIFSSIVLKPFG